jgi:CheY-like chemotaxis protein
MRSKTILIVDDEEDVLKVTEKRLVDAGYTVMTANGGREGLRIAKKEQPDLILLDINMPDLDGGEVGQILKIDPDTKRIPIIFLTALVSRGEAAAPNIGGQCYISKPYDLKELLAAIRERI